MHVSAAHTSLQKVKFFPRLGGPRGGVRDPLTDFDETTCVKAWLRRIFLRNVYDYPLMVLSYVSIIATAFTADC